jgi:small neutral amino acid transporter SnatA (MarC family)
VASEEPVTSPDQHKPTPRRLMRIGSIAIVIILLLMLFGNNEVNLDAKLWLLGISGGIVLLLIADAVLHRNGLRD